MVTCAYCGKCAWARERKRGRWASKRIYHVCANPESREYKKEVVPWEKHRDCFKMRDKAGR